MEQSVANLVDMRDVSFTRGNRCIFDNISLTVPRGKITAIMGPSGIGKTTLLRLIGGQIAPDHGEILDAAFGQGVNQAVGAAAAHKAAEHHGGAVGNESHRLFMGDNLSHCLDYSFCGLYVCGNVV